jgi:RES domain-containing protein
VRFQGAAYRGINPKWSLNPTSGEGAAIRGARFNPKGVQTLYLSTSVEGAFHEATQGFAYKFSPLTMCSYDVDCENVIDLTNEPAHVSAGVSLDEIAGDWALDLTEGRRPVSWGVYDRFHGQAAGILVPSFAVGATPGMINLVLWRWGSNLPHKAVVHDPNHLLPLDQSSWQSDK